MEIHGQGEPRQKGRGRSPGAPWSQGRANYRDPGVPRSQGQDLDIDRPNAPRSQGRANFYDPGAPRSQGQDLDIDRPVAPRSQGRANLDDPGAPRSQGQDLGIDRPVAPRSQGRANYYDPGAPRSQGQDLDIDRPVAPRSQGRANFDDPGAPRSQGQDLGVDRPVVPRSQGGAIYSDPGVPRSQGQDLVVDCPGAPRSQGRANYYDPGVPRSQGQDLVFDCLGAPRSQGRANYDNQRIPIGFNRRGVPRSQGRADNDDPEALRSQDQGFNDCSPGVAGDSQGYDEANFSARVTSQNTYARLDRRHLSRKRRYSSSSEDSCKHNHSSNKRPRSSSLKGRDRNSDILDKFLDILKHVNSTDRPKLNFDKNVIPEFDPMSKEQTVLTWLTKIEECASIYQWDDRETIHYALPKLAGVARTWYQGLSTVLFSWTEWKRKLVESFPCRENYAELLTEMLSLNVRFGESLEHYYYAKVNLLNRCKIYRKQAVDCILYGVEDRAVRVGAQAAQFAEPEHVLKYFRTVRVGQSSDHQDSRTNADHKQHSTRSHTSNGSPLPQGCNFLI